MTLLGFIALYLIASIGIGVYASEAQPVRGATTLIRLVRPRRAEWATEPVFDSARYLRRAVAAG